MRIISAGPFGVKIVLFDCDARETNYDCDTQGIWAVVARESFLQSWKVNHTKTAEKSLNVMRQV